MNIVAVDGMKTTGVVRGYVLVHDGSKVIVNRFLNYHNIACGTKYEMELFNSQEELDLRIQELGLQLRR
jgi:hypothetical protein